MQWISPTASFYFFISSVSSWCYLLGWVRHSRNTAETQGQCRAPASLAQVSLSKSPHIILPATERILAPMWGTWARHRGRSGLRHTPATRCYFVQNPSIHSFIHSVIYKLFINTCSWQSDNGGGVGRENKMNKTESLALKKLNVCKRDKTHTPK